MCCRSVQLNGSYRRSWEPFIILLFSYEVEANLVSPLGTLCTPVLHELCWLWSVFFDSPITASCTFTQSFNCLQWECLFFLLKPNSTQNLKIDNSNSLDPTIKKNKSRQSTCKILTLHGAFSASLDLDLVQRAPWTYVTQWTMNYPCCSELLSHHATFKELQKDPEFFGLVFTMNELVVTGDVFYRKIKALYGPNFFEITSSVRPNNSPYLSLLYLLWVTHWWDMRVIASVVECN